MAATNDAIYRATFLATAYSGDGSENNPYVVGNETALATVLALSRGCVCVKLSDGLDIYGSFSVSSNITMLTINMNGGSIVAVEENSSPIVLEGATFLNIEGAGRLTAMGQCPAVKIPQLVTADSGVTMTGMGSGGATPAPTFADGGKAATTEFVQSEDGKWTFTTFAELSNDAVGTDVAAEQIKVYAAPTLQGVELASPMTSGSEVKEKKSAVKATIVVTPPDGSASQFFKVRFGE